MKVRTLLILYGALLANGFMVLASEVTFENAQLHEADAELDAVNERTSSDLSSPEYRYLTSVGWQDPRNYIYEPKNITGYNRDGLLMHADAYGDIPRIGLRNYRQSYRGVNAVQGGYVGAEKAYPIRGRYKDGYGRSALYAHEKPSIKRPLPQRHVQSKNIGNTYREKSGYPNKKRYRAQGEKPKTSKTTSPRNAGNIVVCKPGDTECFERLDKQRAALGNKSTVGAQQGKKIQRKHTVVEKSNRKPGVRRSRSLGRAGNSAYSKKMAEQKAFYARVAAAHYPRSAAYLERVSAQQRKVICNNPVLFGGTYTREGNWKTNYHRRYRYGGPGNDWRWYNTGLCTVRR